MKVVKSLAILDDCIKDSLATDLKTVIAHSSELAILWKHGFINIDHLFVAMLKQQCMASEYLHSFDAGRWEEKIKMLYPGDSVEKGSIPLTIKAERVLKHTYLIAQTNDETTINTIHLLLAILSFDNEMSTRIPGDSKPNTLTFAFVTIHIRI